MTHALSLSSVETNPQAGGLPDGCCLGNIYIYIIIIIILKCTKMYYTALLSGIVGVDASL